MKTIEEKAKAYDEAIARAKVWKEKSGMPADRQGILDDIFPELKEDEGERIIKSFIRLLKAFHDVNFPTPEGFTREEMFAWLEKQGEKKTFEYENVKPQSSSPISYGKELDKRMNEACNRFFAPNTENNRYSASDLFYAGVKAERDLNMPAWSEEDSPYYDDISEILINLLHSETADVNKDAVQKDLDWLISLRPQNTWKPSEEQIQALEYQVHSTYEGSWQYRASKELLEQLKKL